MGGSPRETRGEEPDPANFDPLPNNLPDANAAREVKNELIRQNDENILKMMYGYAIYHLERGDREMAIRYLVIAGRIALRKNLQINLLEHDENK